MVEGVDTELSGPAVISADDATLTDAAQLPESDSTAWAEAQEMLSVLEPDWTVKSRSQAIYEDIMNSHNFVVQEFTPPPPDVATGGFDLRTFLMFTVAAVVIVVILTCIVKVWRKKSTLGRITSSMDQILTEVSERKASVVEDRDG